MASIATGLVGGYADTTKKKNKEAEDKANQQKLLSALSPKVPGYKRGGKVRRTGLAKVHRGERVLTAKQAKRYRGRSKRR